MGLNLALFVYLLNTSSTLILSHGHDHYRNMCGISDSVRDKGMVFYPDLPTDFQRDPLMRKRYGICVEACPKQYELRLDYAGEGGEKPRQPLDTPWFVALPTFPLAGRCIPYEPWPTLSGTKLCAFPPCTPTDEPKQSKDVCGLKSDQPPTDKFWLLTKPDVQMIRGWQDETGDNQTLVDKLVEVATWTASHTAAWDECKVIVKRDLSISARPRDDSFLVVLLSKYTGLFFRWGTTVYRNKWLVLGLGIGGALVASFIVICLLTIFARCIVISLLVLLFLSLFTADFILLMQGGIIKGNPGGKLLEALENATDVTVPEGISKLVDKASDDDNLREVFKWAGIILMVVNVLLMCLVCAIWKNFEKLIALLKAASRTIREMPSLLVFPLFLVPSMIVTSCLFLYILMGIATTEQEEAEKFMKFWNTCIEPIMFLWKEEDTFKKACMTVAWFAVFSFLWAYFMHVAFFIAIVAFAVSHWYFYRDDPERNAGTGIHSGHWFFGRPALLATLKVFRYHFGSLAFGSFVMAVATLPRIILEYIVKQTNAEANSVTRAIVWVLRCLLWCLQKCLEFITEYSYVYIAVTGKPFCRAAHASFVLIAKYPVQVALDKMATTAIGYLTCVTVPMGMAVLAFYTARHNEWFGNAVFILLLAYVVTRLTVGVYDICVTTMFVCAMRDAEHYDGRYAPEGLRFVCELAAADDSPRQSHAARSSRVRGKSGPEYEMHLTTGQHGEAAWAVHQW